MNLFKVMQQPLFIVCCVTSIDCDPNKEVTW